MKELTQRLFLEIVKIPIIDPHTHVDPRKPVARDLDDLLGYHYYTELAHSAGMPREQIEREYHQRADKAANILAPVEDQCRWLRQIGFADVDCYFKAFELALLGGRKPAAAQAARLVGQKHR